MKIVTARIGRADLPGFLGAWAGGLRKAETAQLRWLTVILLLATVLRIVWVVYAAREPAGLHDPTFYFFYAEQFADGVGYRVPDLQQALELAPAEVKEAMESSVAPLPDGSPTAYYPVGYPAALGGVFALVKHTPIPDNLVLAGAFFHVALGVATVGLTYFVATRLFNPTVGLLSALGLAVFPNLIFHSAAFLTETLFNFLVMAALAVLVSTSWREWEIGRGKLVAFGALLALSALVRPISLLFLPLLLAVLLVSGFGSRRSFTYTGAVLVVAAVVIAPWSIRNAVAMGAPIVISANTGDNLCIGHYPGARGHFALPDHCFPDEPYAGLARPEFEVRRDEDNTRRAIEFAVRHPVAELKLLSSKSWWLWHEDHDGLWAVESFGRDPFIPSDLRTALARTADVYFFVVISLGGLGLAAFVLPPRHPRRLFFLLALLALAGIPLVFFGDSRFHVPVLPLLVVSAAWAVVTVPRLVRSAVRRERDSLGEA